MNVQAEYRSKLRTPEEAVKVIKSGDWVDYGTNVGFPTLLDAALAKRRDELTDVKLRGNLLFGPIQTVECDPTREHFLYNSWHCSAYERKLCDKGLCNYIPMIFRNVVPYYRHFLTVNVAMLGVTPMDRHGYFNFSCSTGVARGIMEKADIVILEVNEHLPRTLGGFDECVHISEVDYVVEGEHAPLPQFPVAKPTEEDVKIAQIIVPQIPSGATLQLGIGAVPEAVGMFLKDKHHLGIHTELFADSLVELLECGAADNTLKPIHRGKTVLTFALGTQKVYDFLDDNHSVEVLPVDYVNNPAVIAQHPKFVSVNAALEVDFFGQVCAESIGTRHVSGSGGQVDYVRGATQSEGGKSFIAFPSTAKGGTISRIRATLTPGAIVTTSKNDVDYIVTEYGVAKLRGKSLSQRAKALISIAHPKFREELTAQAKKENIMI